MASFSVEWHSDPDDRWAAFESAVVAAGGRLPLPARAAWVRNAGQPVRALGVRRDRDPVAMLGVERYSSRVVPFHEYWRVERAGGARFVEAAPAAFAALRDRARRHRVIRLTVRVLERNAEGRRRLGEALRASGFLPAARARHYLTSSVIDLGRSEPELLGGMRPGARRHLRATERLGLRIRPIDGDHWAAELDRVSRETWSRAGRRPPKMDWPRIIRASRVVSEHSALFGLWDAPGGRYADRLLAFCWACGHVDHVHYAAGGSVRVDGTNPPLMYGLAWEMIRWAGRCGARWFDFGGLPPASERAQQLLNIARFKHSFGGTLQAVAEEWDFTPRPGAAAWAESVGRLVRGPRR